MTTSEYQRFRSEVYDHFDSSDKKARIALGRAFKKLLGDPINILDEAINLCGLKDGFGLNASATNTGNIKRGEGQSEYYIALYFWLHKNMGHSNYTAEIDVVVFGGSNHAALDFNKKWQLGTENEKKRPNADFCDLACRHIQGNSGVSEPASISFSPYFEPKEVNGFFFGFTEVQISTSLISSDTDIDVSFAEYYDEEKRVGNALVVKSGAEYRGKWNIRSIDDGILSGVIQIDGEAAAIHCRKEVFDFTVTLRASNIHSVIKYVDGSEIEEKNKKTILKMLISDEIFGEKHNSKSLKSVTDVNLIEQHCRLSKVPIYEI